MEYKAEEEAELREAIEKGRKAKIAYEALCRFLDDRRERIINDLETIDPSEMIKIRTRVESLQIMRMFCEAVRRDIDFGEIAEERMKESGR